MRTENELSSLAATKKNLSRFEIPNVVAAVFLDHLLHRSCRQDAAALLVRPFILKQKSYSNTVTHTPRLEMRRTHYYDK